MSTLWCVQVAVAALAWVDKKIAIWEKYNNYPMFLYKQSIFRRAELSGLECVRVQKSPRGAGLKRGWIPACAGMTVRAGMPGNENIWAVL